MTRSVRIYQNRLQSSVLALSIELGTAGAVQFTPGEDAIAAAFLMDLVGKGISKADEPYLVAPEAGAAYLDAVANMLGRTSRWLVVAE
jgi:hypothetical protein